MCSAETETKKCQDAEAKGLAIVDEAWVRARLSGAGGGAASASPSKATTSKKKGKQAASDEDEEDDVGADTEEDGGGAALAGLVFAITGTLSVPRAQFEKLITDNGGQVAKSVTNACTHLVSAETGTKKCQDAEEKGCAIVDEDWVRARVAMGGSVVGRSDMIPPQSFVPLPTFVNELIATDEDEGRLSYSNAKRNVGQLIYNRDDDEDAEDLWKVVSHKTKDGEDEYVIRSEKNPKETQELGIDELCDSWMTQPPAHVLNRWDRYQNKRIAEGVWMSTADPVLQSNLNSLVDAFAAAETPDYHPGTNGIVRDLVHPSLYPLIIDPATINTNERNRWYRQHERSRFQWLSAEVAVDANGSAKFTSPINNLDTAKYPALTAALEQTFTALVPGFEKVLIYRESEFVYFILAITCRCGSTQSLPKLILIQHLPRVLSIMRILNPSVSRTVICKQSSRSRITCLLPVARFPACGITREWRTRTLS
jgi:hypothetical protein